MTEAFIDHLKKRLQKYPAQMVDLLTTHVYQFLINVVVDHARGCASPVASRRLWIKETS